VWGAIIVSNMALADARANLDVFEEARAGVEVLDARRGKTQAVALAAGVAPSAVAVTIKKASRRRLTDTLEVSYVIETTDYRSFVVLEDMEALAAAEFDDYLATAAAGAAEFDLVVTDSVGEPAAGAWVGGSGSGQPVWRCSLDARRGKM